MTESGPWLAECERELIHMPGTIQDWGALVVAGETDLLVRHAAANLEEFIDAPAAGSLDRPLSELFGADVTATLARAAGATPVPGTVAAIRPPGAGHGAMSLSVHCLNGALYVELQPVALERPPAGAPEPPHRGAPEHAGHVPPAADPRGVMESLQAATTAEALFTAAAAELRRATGFDRAMVYRFDAVGHGEVVAEDRALELEPFLGLHYPASDVPRQARRLYLRQRVRVIADVMARPVPLLGVPGSGGAPDLSLAALRSPSPIHVQYLRTMGVRASIAVSLTVDGVLWGMLVCHHRGRAILPPAVRAHCDLIGQLTSLLIPERCRSDARREAAAHAEHLAALSDRLAQHRGGAGTLAQTLAGQTGPLLALCAADGMLLRIDGVCTSFGSAPAGRTGEALLDVLLAQAPEDGAPFATTELAPQLPAELAAQVSDAGALALPLSYRTGDAIAWLRAEQTREVRWGGDPRTPVEVDSAGMMHPRRSFAVWREQVRGQSLPWTQAQLHAAGELRQALDHRLARCAEAELARLRNHDPVTGLPNLRLLHEVMQAWSLQPPCACLLSADLDEFAALQQRHGAIAANAVLVQASQRIVALVSGPGAHAGVAGGGTVVARIAEAGFGVFCPDLPVRAATSLAEALRAALAEPFTVGGHAVGLSASVGAAPIVAALPALGADELLLRADLAVQTARRQGGGRALVFASYLPTGANRAIEIEQELRAALAGEAARSGTFHLVYQPYVSLADAPPPAVASGHSPAVVPPPGAARTRPLASAAAALRGFKALLRWEHPRLGSIPPGAFLGIAEASGLIHALGSWVLRAAIERLADWRGLAGGLPVHVWRIAVNVSAHQLAHPGFVGEVRAQLAAGGVAPHCLAIEAKEAAFASQPALAALAELRAAGLRVAVTDFGSGAASLALLRRLPADELKLDRGFLHAGEAGACHEDLLGALVQLGRSVGLSVIAEGVDTDQHLAAVTAAGCDAAQGALFAEPMSAEDALPWIAGASPLAAVRPAPAKLAFPFREIVDAADEAVVVVTAPGGAAATSGGAGRGAAADVAAGGGAAAAIVYANPAFTRLTGWKFTEALGRPMQMLDGERTDPAAARQLEEAMRAGRETLVRMLSYARSGMPFWCERRLSALRDQAGRITHFVAILRDVTHETRRLDELETLAERDPLTSIANRRGLERYAAGLAVRPGAPLCVAYLDIDHFKTVNDTLGHAAGDALLLGIADLLAESTRRADFVGRLGGDEFVVCMPATQPNEALLMAERLQRVIAGTTFDTPKGPVQTNCSIGVAAVAETDVGIAAVIARADAALYAAKSAGRGRVTMAAPVAA